VDNIEAPDVALTMGDGTRTTHVTSTSDHDEISSVELDKVSDLASGQVKLDSVVDCTVHMSGFSKVDWWYSPLIAGSG
jgi:hypothetical protein